MIRTWPEAGPGHQAQTQVCWFLVCGPVPCHLSGAEGQIQGCFTSLIAFWFWTYWIWEPVSYFPNKLR